MNDNELINIPDLVDEQPHFLVWQLDEIVTVVIGLIVGIIIGSPLFGITLGFVLKHYYTKIRDGKPKGYFLHKIRRMGFSSSSRYSSMQPPLVKKYLA